MTPPRSLLIVSSCSATKLEPTADGIDHFVPARDLYQGRSHQTVRRAIDALRKRSPDMEIRWAIVSALHGVVDDDQRVTPYEATLAGQSRHKLVARGRQLQLHRDLAALLQMVDVGLFLLGEDYLVATEPPIAAAPLEIYLSARGAVHELPGVRVVPAGVAEARALGAMPLTVKADLFGRFVDAIATDGWDTALDQLLAGTLTRPATALQPALLDLAP